MIQAIGHYEASGKWRMRLFLALPDLWHALIQFTEPEHMEKILRDWKRYVAKCTGVAWQDGFFEHRLRSTQSENEKWHFILLNPVRKGFVKAPEEWSFVWQPNEAAG